MKKGLNENMKSMLKTMKKKNSGISADVIPAFEGIIQKYEELGAPSLGPECDAEFEEAMKEYLTKEQRFWLYEQNGACKGTGADKERKIFALEHAHRPLADRLRIFTETFGREAVLNDDDTITVTFACTHGYYKQVREGKITSLPPLVESYFERCAGGRLYEYQKALGIKLKIKSVDISTLDENLANPVVFTFEIIE
ncbi:MAG: hypothetical protein FWE74_00565 [Oscillospiraceae bacterium]|nr:hypothetical protein [Oscillospiraceae bacterium]